MYHCNIKLKKNIMKKLFLCMVLTALTLTINSCSSDDGDGQTLSFKVNGVQKSFKVTPETNGFLIVVYGSIGNPVTPTETVSFSFPIGDLDNSIGNFVYSDAGGVDDGTSNIDSNFTINTVSQAKGTFSGTIERPNGDIVNITDGKLFVKPRYIN